MAVAIATKAVPIGNGKLFAHAAIQIGTAWIVAAASASATVSASSVGSTTSIIHVSSDVAVLVTTGGTPVATRSTSCHIPAGVIKPLIVDPGDKISVIALTAVGTVYVTEAVSI